MGILPNNIQNMIINKETSISDLEKIVNFPQSIEESYYLFNIHETLNFEILKHFYDKRFGSTSFLKGNQLVAYANFYRYKTDPKEIVYLGNVMVDTQHRGNGYSKEVIKVMSQKAKNKFNCKELRLAVFCNNTRAYILYIKMGFKVISVEERQGFHSKSESIFIMSKSLT